MKNVMSGTYIKGEESCNLNFYIELSTVNKLRFVNSVVGLLVDEENKNYDSIMRDLVFDFCVVDIFTDVDTSELWKSDSFVDDVEKFLYETNIVDVVKANAKIGLIDELNKAIDLSIQYKTGIHPNMLNEALAKLVDTLERKVNEIDLNTMSEMAHVFSEIGDGLTPDSIVKAYMNTNIAKKNLEEVEESKNRTAKFIKETSNVIDIEDSKNAESTENK